MATWGVSGCVTNTNTCLQQAETWQFGHRTRKTRERRGNTGSSSDRGGLPLPTPPLHARPNMGEGLRAQATELERLIGLAQRETSRQLLRAELARVTEALASATTSDPPPAPRPAPAPAPAPLRLSTAPTTAPIEYSSISSYAWDHSNKFVKVYLTIPGLEKIPDAQIEAVFGERSLVLSVAGVSTPPVNRRLNVPTLCHAVREDQCSWVRKPSDMLLIKLRKASDGQEWASLNDSAAKKELQQKERAEANKARTPREFPRHCMHPSRRSIAGLHRPPPGPVHCVWQGKSTGELLQQMYAEADEEGKLALSQAWEAGREKREANK